MAAVKETIDAVAALEKYAHGFTSDIEQEFAPRGLNADIVRFISEKKGEPEWMLEWRLAAYERWLAMEEPTWAAVKYEPVDYQDLFYYAAPKQKEGPKSLDEVDPEILEIYKKLGIPLKEQEVLAGVQGANYWLHPYDSIEPTDLLPATFSFHYLEDAMSFTLGEVNVRVLHMPGHTLGMTNLLLDDRYLLSGDTVLIESIGRPDLGGRAKTWVPLLYHSLQRLLALPDRTMVLPSHFGHIREADDAGCYRATLGALRSHNEGLRMFDRGPEAFSAYILESLPEHPKSYDDIRRVNTGLLQVDETKAGELELGRNRCGLSHREAGQD